MDETKEMKTIMIVDDVPENLRLLAEMLKNAGFAIVAFPRGELALRAAAKNPPDLILLDINMPGISGYETCLKLKEDMELRDIPVIFMSALSETLDKVRAFQCGGVDYITKPFQLEEVQMRIRTHLRLRSLQEKLEQHNHHLEALVQEKVENIQKSHLATIFSLAKLAEYRDTDTGRHLERVQLYCRAIAEELSGQESYAAELTPDFIQCIYHASPLHDIGKVGIEDSILLKPGRLTPDEYKKMQTHSLIGAETLQRVYDQHPYNQFINMGIKIARWHHEKWDGSGYPDGLSRESIPLCARIMALCDVYDALCSQRCYKEPIPHEQVVEMIRKDSGSHFDPKVVDTFLRMEDIFRNIHREIS